MLIAATQGNDGRRQLVVGLDAENMRRLANDEPIKKDLRLGGTPVPGLEEWDLVILGPEDMARFVAHYGGSNGG